MTCFAYVAESILRKIGLTKFLLLASCKLSKGDETRL